MGRGVVRPIHRIDEVGPVRRCRAERGQSNDRGGVMAMILRAPRQPTPDMAPCRRCGRRHRTWRTLACCRWRRAIWVSGNGRFASVSLCAHSVGGGRYEDTTVQLYREHDAAVAAKRTIDATGCGNSCSRNHFVTDLARVAQEESE